MKRFIAAATALLSLAAFYSPAQAVQAVVAPHMAIQPLSFRHHTANNSSASIANSFVSLDELGNWVVDSLTCNSAANGKSTGGADTLATIDLIRLGCIVSGVGSPATALTDTLTTIGALIFSDAGSTAAIDSVYLQVQFSVDGKNWTQNYDTVPLGFPILMTQSGIAHQKQGSFILRSGASQNTIPNTANGSGETRFWPIVRFIICDQVAGGLQHNWKAWFSYISAGDVLGH